MNNEFKFQKEKFKNTKLFINIFKKNEVEQTKINLKKTVLLPFALNVNFLFAK